MALAVRDAVAADAEVIAEFNSQLAWETEQKRLDPATISAGVRAVLLDRRKGRYLVACDGETVVGQLMHTYEWSDWRNGDIWWLQSVYVSQSYRRRGVFRLLFEHLAEAARHEPNVVGIRLYVEEHNTAAQATYTKLGMQDSGYVVFETMHRNG